MDCKITWISTTERMPEYDMDFFETYGVDKEYLVCIDGGIVPTTLAFGHWDDYDNGDREFGFYDEASNVYSCTAWAELPEIYNSNSQNTLIELPCPFGTQLYSIRTAVNSSKLRIGKATILSHNNLGYVLSHYNKTMFTKEVALKKIKEIGDVDV